MLRKLLITGLLLTLLTVAYVSATVIIVDNTDDGCQITGKWNPSTKNPIWWGDNYLAAKEGSSYYGGEVEYTPNIQKTGLYKVSMYYTEPDDATILATNVPVTICYDGGSKTITVDETKNGEMWFDLGIYEFEEGFSGSVTVSTQGADNWVVADAVKFESLIPSRNNGGSGEKFVRRDIPTIDREANFTKLDGLYPIFTPLKIKVKSFDDLNDVMVVYDSGGEMRFGAAIREHFFNPITIKDRNQWMQEHP